jgi:hypothetical protein
MSVDSERMLKLENEVKELKTYVNKLVGAVKTESNNSIELLKKSVEQINIYNKCNAGKKEPNSVDLYTQIKSIVNQDYITDLYRNK